MAVYAVVLLSTVFMVKILIYSPSSTDHTNLNFNTDKEDKRLIILLSQPRSGSSWIGSFFDAHPDVFYVYEPLHPQAYQASKVHLTAQLFQERILRSLCLCEFSPEVISYGLYDRSSKLENSRGLLRNPSPETMTKLCQHSRHTVAKVLQLWDSEVLSKVSREYSCKIDVIHLIRDPRASIKSRMDTFNRFMSNETEIDEFTPQLIENSSRVICDQIMDRVTHLFNSDDLQSYRTLLFEKVSKHPLEIAKELFQDMGISWHPVVEERVVHSSSGIDIESGGFGTVKDSAKMVGAWRRTATAEYISAVEIACSDMMNKFKYSRMYQNER